MKIALPVAAGRLSPHFGHCETFRFFEADPPTKQLRDLGEKTPPPHEPGALPRWLAEEGVSLIIAGGMGRRAQQLFAERGIETLVGAPSQPPETVVRAWLDGTLATGTNLCDH